MLSEILNPGSRKTNTPQQNLKNTTGVPPIPTLQGLSFLFKHHILHFHIARQFFFFCPLSVNLYFTGGFRTVVCLTNSLMSSSRY